jgi:hypothetical protein
MKRTMLVVVFVLAGVFSLGTAWAGPPAWANAHALANSHESAGPAKSAGPPAAQDVGGEWSSPADFTTKFWQEKFFGGGPGQEGNTLMAIGQGFVFQNAILTVGPVPLMKKPEWCDGAVAYETIYANGRLTLNSSGPWLTKGTLIDRDVIAVNTSCHTQDGALLGFRLKIGIDPDNEVFEQFAELPYTVEANFDIEFDADGLPTNYKIFEDEDGITVQKGYYFGATITIESPDL